jgi:hypothetical protein
MSPCLATNSVLMQLIKGFRLDVRNLGCPLNTDT